MAGVRRARTRRVALWGLALIALAAASGCGSSTNSSTSSSTNSNSTSTGQPATTSPSASATTSSSSPGPEGIPLEAGPALASASTTAPGIPVDGVHCAPVEQLAYHIHSHLQVYVNGQPRSLPGGIGMQVPVAEQTAYGPFYGATHCYYWLHTHATDGVIHIESPTARVYTLGTFFDEWGQPLSSDQVATAKGHVTAFFNGKPWTRSPRAIPLLPHGVIQIDVGTPTVPFGPISWAGVKL